MGQLPGMFPIPIPRTSSERIITTVLQTPYKCMRPRFLQRSTPCTRRLNSCPMPARAIIPADSDLSIHSVSGSSVASFLLFRLPCRANAFPVAYPVLPYLCVAFASVLGRVINGVNDDVFASVPNGRSFPNAIRANRYVAKTRSAQLLHRASGVLFREYCYWSIRTLHTRFERN